MNSNLSRFKISSLIAMARTTEDMEQRERYISLAEEELDIISQSTCSLCTDSVESFIYSKIKRDTNKKISRTDIYKVYSKFCERKHLQPISKNVLYRMLRENGVREFKSNGERFFRLDILED